jgi:ABC-type glycerol-3-phosphate transport system substrate-binding protein
MGAMSRGWLLLLGVLLALVACRETPAPTGAGVRLVYWPPPNRFDLEMSRKLVASWNAEHPEIVVELKGKVKGVVEHVKDAAKDAKKALKEAVK